MRISGAVALDLHDTHRGRKIGVEVEKDPAKTVDHLRWPQTDDGEGSERRAQLCHHRGCSQEVAGDIANSEQDWVVELDRLGHKFPADLNGVASRLVTNSDIQVGGLRQGLGQHGVLKGERNLMFEARTAAGSQRRQPRPGRNGP